MQIFQNSIVSFEQITKELQDKLRSNLPQIRFLLKKNPAMAYTKITEIGRSVGEKYKIKLIVNFPQEGKIEKFEMYGKQDLSIIIDQTKKNFPIDRKIVKSKASELFGDVKIVDAYMYEGKEGVKIFFERGRIDVLPHSLHVWCEFSGPVTQYCNWLFKNVYLISN